MDSDGKEISNSYEKVLVSVGRTPNTDNLMLENAGIKVDSNKFILVDEYRRTNIKNIFAIGDITGNPMLAHKATHEGKVAAEVCSGIASAFEPQVIPAVIFTEPLVHVRSKSLPDAPSAIISIPPDVDAVIDTASAIFSSAVILIEPASFKISMSSPADPAAIISIPPAEACT